MRAHEVVQAVLGAPRVAGRLDSSAATPPRRKMQLVMSMERWLPLYMLPRMFSVPAMIMRMPGCSAQLRVLLHAVDLQ